MFNITEWLAYSTNDMRTWTAHGPVMKPTDFAWVQKDAWASQVHEKDGKFWFYTAVEHDPATSHGKAIGVAVADSPLGPFVDARGSALVRNEDTKGPHHWDDIDPTLWTEPDGWSYEGKYWKVRGAIRHGEIARGGRPHPHILFGGKGGPRMAALVAEYGDEFNLNSASPEDAPKAYARIRAACRERGRDPDEVVYSAMTGVLVAESEADLRTRVADLLAALGQDQADADAWLAERRQRWIMGTPDEAHERVAALEERGTQRIMLQDFLPRDLDHVRLMGRIFGA